MITPQIVDNIIAYKRAVVDTTTAEIRNDWDEIKSCREEENIRLDGLFAVIRIAINDAASQDPYSPEAINGDVNQAPEPAPQPRVAHADFDTGLMATLRNLKHLAQSEPPKPTVLDKLKADPDVAPVFEHLPPPLPEED